MTPMAKNNPPAKQLEYERSLGLVLKVGILSGRIPKKREIKRKRIAEINCRYFTSINIKMSIKHLVIMSNCNGLK